MRFTPFLLTIVITGCLYAVDMALPAFGITRSSYSLSLWASCFLLTIMAMGVTRIGMQFFGPAFCHGSRQVSQDQVSQDHPPTVALTFDDGPDPAVTPALLALLAEHEIKATFFCIGSAVRKHPELTRQIIERGHQVQNHTDTHHWSVNFAFEKRWERELQGANEAIEAATGRRPCLMRPPLGLTNPHLHSVLRKLDLALVGWDVRSFDTLGKPVAKVIYRVVNRTRPGSVVLLHDGKQDVERVCAITRGVVESLKAKGFLFVTAGEMMGEGES